MPKLPLGAHSAQPGADSHAAELAALGPLGGWDAPAHPRIWTRELAAAVQRHGRDGRQLRGPAALGRVLARGRHRACAIVGGGSGRPIPAFLRKRNEILGRHGAAH